MSVETSIAEFNKLRNDFLEDLFTFLRFETISAQPAHANDMQHCGQWILNQLLAAGLKSEIIPTSGHPVIFADSDPSASGHYTHTLLFYGHYDVQPIGDPALWTSPPFEPTIRDGAIYARGSADDKGQLMTILAAVKSWRAAGCSWPLRLKLLIEGEEEIGSPNLAEFVRQSKDRLACNYVVIADSSKFDAVTPALPYSTRGLVYKEITLDGPNRDLHSGQYGGVVANPANVLARIIASLHDERHRVTIPGFYDDVLPLSEHERRQLLKHPLSDADLIAGTGVPAPAGEAGFSNIERVGARPTLDVNGLLSGYTSQGSATIIPARATAKVSMRLVPHQDPQKVSAGFDKYIEQLCPPSVGCKINTQATCAPYVAPTDSPGMQAAAWALAESFGKPPILNREGGTLPILPLFKEVLRADILILGFSRPDCNIHSPNEFFHLSDFDNGTRCVIRFLDRISHLSI